jgi:hypothetical protein
MKKFIINNQDLLCLRQVSRALYREDYLDHSQQSNLAKMIYDVIKNIERNEIPEIPKPTSEKKP